MTKATALKASKQINEAIGQRLYKQMQQPFMTYKVVSVVTNRVVASSITMEQAVRQFHPITQFILKPV